MKRTEPHYSLALALLLAVLGAVICAACGERAPARFPHLLHLTGIACGKPGKPACLSCSSCHAVSKTASSVPPSSLCASCHRADLPRVSAALAHATPDQAPIAFDHARHLGMPKIRGQCVTCHSGVVQAGSPPLPPMARCFGCHEHEAEWQQATCTPCHAAGDLARTPPRSFLRHDAEFARRHGQFAVEDRKLCQACHSQKQCNDCHDTTQDLTVERRRPEQVETTLVHGGDFLVRHAIEAQAEPTRCARCHAPETCDACHLQRGVSAIGVGGRNPHPPGWVTNNPGASSGHGREARRDILLCASCHDQGPATNCIRCHRVGGYGGNPHPGGWRSARSPQEGMCRYCHD